MLLKETRHLKEYSGLFYYLFYSETIRYYLFTDWNRNSLMNKVISTPHLFFQRRAAYVLRICTSNRKLMFPVFIIKPKQRWQSTSIGLPRSLQATLITNRWKLLPIMFILYHRCIYTNERLAQTPQSWIVKSISRSGVQVCVFLKKRYPLLFSPSFFDVSSTCTVARKSCKVNVLKTTQADGKPS